jgi:hypothetical protein
VWLETPTHVLDLSTCGLSEAMGVEWPAPLYSPKARLAKNPKKARGEQKVLVWRSTAALAAVEAAAPIAACTARAFELYCDQPALKCAALPGEMTNITTQRRRQSGSPCELSE